MPNPESKFPDEPSEGFLGFLICQSRPKVAPHSKGFRPPTVSRFPLTLYVCFGTLTE